MGVPLLVKCGLVQFLCSLSLLLLKIFGNGAVSSFAVVAIILYAIAGALLLCLGSFTKNLFVVLSANISTLLSLMVALGLAIYVAVVEIPKQYKPWVGDLHQEIALLVNSLLMLSATAASTMKVFRLWFCSRDAASDSETIPHVIVRSNWDSPSASTSTLEVADERNLPSRQPGSVEDYLFQHLISDSSEEDQTEDSPPSYQIATSKNPCNRCKFETKNKRDFVEEFRKRSAHWSCGDCERQLSTF